MGEVQEGPSEHHLATLRKRMAEIDSLPPKWRDLIHEYGWLVISVFYRANVPVGQVRHLIEHVLNGSYEIRERRLNTQRISMAGERLGQAMASLGLPGSGQAVAEALVRHGGMVCVRRPLPEMVDASLNALPRRQPMAWVSDRRKHEIRLGDALQASFLDQHGAGGTDG